MVATTAIQNRDAHEMGAALAEKVLVGGDLSRLSPAERLDYIQKMCQSLGLNPTTRPFEYLTLQGKMTLYARKDATDQLRSIHDVSITKVEHSQVGDAYIVTVYAERRNGRIDSDVGAVNIAGLKGDNLANAIMKAITKAKRRVTLSICGLGILDETEIETIPNAYPSTRTWVEPTGTVAHTQRAQEEPPAVPYLEVPEDWLDSQPTPPPSMAGQATEKQVKAIYAIGRASKRLSESQVDDRSVEIFGIRPGELTKAEASQFIDMLKGDPAA